MPMLAPRSYTREDVIELQCHGSEVCLRRVLRACVDAGARLAEPGQETIFLLMLSFFFLAIDSESFLFLNRRVYTTCVSKWTFGPYAS